VGAGEGDPENLLKYNVYVLDADVDEMRKVVPHLVMKVCEGGVPGGTSSSGSSSSSCAASAGGGGAHTDGPDGHLVDMNMDVDPSTPPATTAEGKEQSTYSEPNTVDFAQREKEEMRDLTKASEIISLFPSLPPPTSPPAPTSSSTPMNSPPSSEQGRDSPQPITTLDLSTTRSHFDPQVGQIFLGNADDVPLTPRLGSIPPPRKSSVIQETISGGEEAPPEDDPFNYCPANDPARGLGYDICVECHDLAPFPTSAHLRKAEEHLNVLDVWWAERWLAAKRKEGGDVDDHDALIDLPTRPPPNASAVIHLPFPSSPTNTQMSMSALMPVIRFLEKWVRPVVRASPAPVPSSPPPPPPQTRNAATGTPTVPSNASPRRWSAVASMMPHFSSFTSSSSAQPQSQPHLPDSNPDSDSDPNATNNASTSAPTPPPTSRTRSFTSPSLHPTQQQPPVPISPLAARTRPLKILIYSSDGYTESSVPALCLLMAIKSLSLPEAYLELQVAKRRSFFVYQGDLGLLRRVEGKVREEREREKEREVVNGNGKRVLGAVGGQGRQGWDQIGRTSAGQAHAHAPPPAAYGRRPAKSVSFSQGPPVVVVSHQPTPKSPPIVVPSQSLNLEGCDVGSCSAPQIQGSASSSQMTVKGRPRASTSPWLPSSFGGDHQSWFNDPRFDGSFPSRVLPFLYLGNL
jgi:dual specificity MAP kinase phosphatase